MLCSRHQSPFTAASEPRSLLRSKCTGRVQAFPTPREIPGGFWFAKESTSDNNELLYGRDFIIQRPQQSTAELAATGTAQVRFAEKAEQRLTVNNQQTPVANCLWDVDVTDYTVLGERGLLPGVRTPFLLPGSVMTVTPAMPATTCTGMILHPSFDRVPEEAPEEDKNPRRTKKVKFTCKICDTTTVKRVSPHGWSRGTVLAKCDGCDNIHKLWDHLNVFHELKGNVFPPKVPSNLKIPEGLPQKPSMDYHRHPAVYPHFPGEDTC